jgi:hypothetical protein
MKKLPSKWNMVAVPFVLSIFMSAIISFVSTFRAVGFIDGLFGKRLGAWGLSWLVAFPALLMVLPIVRRIVARFVELPGPAR